MPFSPEILIAPDHDGWAEAARNLVLEIGAQAIQDYGQFVIALSGGNTPERLYRALSSCSNKSRLDWTRTIFFFSDERCVPPDHPQSNFGLANRLLFKPLSIHPDQVHRMLGEAPDPELAARDYERHLRAACRGGTGSWPMLDLVLLGLGHDGHTASIFPGTSSAEEEERCVTVGHAPSEIPTRLTLTLGVINRANVVLFLVTGANKAEMVKTILEPDVAAERRVPAALVKPEQGRLIWLLDAASAAQLAKD